MECASRWMTPAPGEGVRNFIRLLIGSCMDCASPYGVSGLGIPARTDLQPYSVAQ